MAKKQMAVSLRKPPPADLNSFVTGAVATNDSAVIQPNHVVEQVKEESSLPPQSSMAKEALGRIADVGRGLRQLSVYLPSDIASRLALYCVDTDRDPSRVIADAVVRHLDREASKDSTIASTPGQKVGQAIDEMIERVRAIISAFPSVRTPRQV